jgi:chromate transporter
MKGYLELVWAFVIIGATVFGGGYAAVPLLERELVKKRGWLTMDEMMDFYSIAQITPGLIIVNIATFIGCKRKGFFGGVLATFGFAVPGVCFMLIISLFVRQFVEYAPVQHALAGIRIAVSVIILDAVMRLVKGFYKQYKAVVICVIAFVLSAIVSVSPVLVILGAGLAGFLLYSPRNKLKNEKENE